MNFITIITPTFNRAYLLENLYKSLCFQTNKDFEWLIVDDGSTDNTREIVDNFIKIANFKISYMYQQNKGKHAALNLGIEYINSDLTLIVDSDDYLLDTALENIYQIHLKYQNNNKIAAYAFLKCYPNGNPVIDIDCEECAHNYIDYRIKNNRPGDMAEVFKTSILKQYKFHIFENEKFISEDTAWIEIAKLYDFIFINKSIYVCVYKSDGLSANDKKMKFKSPLGSMYRGIQLMYSRCGIIANIKGAIIYNCYYKKTNNSILTGLSIRESLLIYLTKPLGIYYRIKWKRLGK